jgi:hypothetical protein
MVRLFGPWPLARRLFPHIPPARRLGKDISNRKLPMLAAQRELRMPHPNHPPGDGDRRAEPRPLELAGDAVADRRAHWVGVPDAETVEGGIEHFVDPSGQAKVRPAHRRKDYPNLAPALFARQDLDSSGTWHACPPELTTDLI